MEEELRQSDDNYRIIAENTTDIISIEDKSGIVLYTSPSSELIKGYSPIDLIGSSGFTLVYPEDLPLVESVFKEALLTKTTRLVKYRYIHRNSTLIYLEAKVTPVLGDNGEVEHFVLVARDITELKKSEDYLRKWERLSVAGEIAAGVAHEIRNPLTSIKGFLKLLDRDGVDIEYYDIILKDFNQVESIISEFLALAKPEASLLFQATDLKTILTKVVSLLESEANLKNIKIECKLSNGPVLINCDESQLKKAFLNIIVNAIESMTSGSKVKVFNGEKR
jgi:PAS domain S-box-containing protein